MGQINHNLLLLRVNLGLFFSGINVIRANWLSINPFLSQRPDPISRQSADLSCLNSFVQKNMNF